MSAPSRAVAPNGSAGQAPAQNNVLANFHQYMPPQIQAASNEEKITWVRENIQALKMRMNAGAAGGGVQPRPNQNGQPTQIQSPRPPAMNNNFPNGVVPPAMLQQLQRQIASNPQTANASPQQQRDLIAAQLQQIQQMKEAGMMQGGSVNGPQGVGMQIQPGPGHASMQVPRTPMMRTPSQNQLHPGDPASSNSPMAMHSSPQQQFVPPNPNIGQGLAQHQQQMLPNNAQVMQMQNVILQQQQQQAALNGGMNGNTPNTNTNAMLLQAAALQQQNSPQQSQQIRAQLPINVVGPGRPPTLGQIPGQAPQIRRPVTSQTATPHQQAQAMQAMAAARQAQQMGQAPTQGVQQQQGQILPQQQHTVDDIVNNLQSYGDMRTRNELDPSKLQMLNTILSNPGVVQNQFSARANQLAQANAELRGQNPQLRQQINAAAALQGANGVQTQGQNFHTQQQRHILAQAQQARALQQQRAHAQSMLDQHSQGQNQPMDTNGQGSTGVISVSQGAIPQGAMVSIDPTRGGLAEQAMPQVNVAGVRPAGGIDQALTVIHDMKEEARHEFFRKNPNVQPTYDNNIQRILGERNAKILAQAAATQSAAPGTGVAMRGAVKIEGNVKVEDQGGPLPNLQLPTGRQRAGTSMSMTQQQQQQMAAIAGNQNQVPNQQFNAAGNSPASGGGTPHMKPSGVVPIPRAGTPNRIASMQAQSSGRGSPTAIGSPQIRQADQVIQDVNGHIRRTSQQLVPGQVATLLPAAPGSAGVGNFNYAASQLHAQEARPNVNGAANSPHIPDGFVAVQIHSLVINETPAESATISPKPSAFPNKIGPRRTLTSGLGPGPILGTPVLGARPAAFEELLKGLQTSLNMPNGKSKATRGTLFDKRDQLEVEAVDEAVPSVGKVDVKSASPEVEAMLKPVEEPENDVHVPVFPSSSTKRKIGDLAKSVDRELTVSETAEEFLLELADEFIDSIGETGARLAKHRKGNKLEVKDIQLHLERDLNLHIPGWAYDSIRIDSAPFNRKPAGAVAAANRAARLLAVQQARNGIVTAKPGTSTVK